jgi:hypothetical protein
MLTVLVAAVVVIGNAAIITIDNSGPLAFNQNFFVLFNAAESANSTCFVGFEEYDAKRKRLRLRQHHGLAGPQSECEWTEYAPRECKCRRRDLLD